MIRLEDLGVKRGGEGVLLADELEVDREIVAVMGPNGAGKTSLLQALADRLPHSGSKATTNAWYVPARPPEAAMVEARELVRSHGAEDPETLLDRVGYEGPTLVARGSQGERALVALAGALGRDGDLLLDEPFSHLDPPRTARVWPALEEHAEDHGVLVTTHDPALASRADRVVLLSGTIVARGEPRDVIAEAPLEECYGAPVDVAWTDLGPVVAGRDPRS